MKDTLLKMYVKAQVLRESLKNEEGQDLIEYALVAALVAFGAVAGMKGLANGINTAFGHVSTQLTNAIP